jgi:predicted dehydrogenase
LHYLEHFGGRITHAKSAFLHSPKSINGGETGLDMLLKFESGAAGTVHVSCNTPNRIQHALTFTCEKATILLEGNNTITDGFTVAVFDANGARRIKVKKDSGRTGEDERVQVVRKLARRFAGACSKNTQMSPSFIDGVRVQELIEKIRKSTAR